MNNNQAQALIREASPGFLAEHPPVGVVASLAAITENCKPKYVEFRQPFARIPDEKDDWQECHGCGGDGEMWASEDQDYQPCGYCGGSGKLPFMSNQCFLMVYRDGHSVETLVTVLDSGAVNAFVSCSQLGFPSGKEVPLFENEKEVARQALGKPGAVESKSPNTIEGA